MAILVSMVVADSMRRDCAAREWKPIHGGASPFSEPACRTGVFDRWSSWLGILRSSALKLPSSCEEDRPCPGAGFAWH